MTAMIVTNPATEAQVRFIQKLALEQGTAQPTAEQIASWDKRKASEIIDWYLARQDKVDARNMAAHAAKQATVDVPAGCYALTIDTDSNDVSFFKVDRPTEGRWAGYTFVKQFASDNEYPVKGARKDMVLAAIAQDPKGASELYGRETKHCGVCSRKLTNDESRERGIGPVCASKMGW